MIFGSYDTLSLQHQPTRKRVQLWTFQLYLWNLPGLETLTGTLLYICLAKLSASDAFTLTIVHSIAVTLAFLLNRKHPKFILIPGPCTSALLCLESYFSGCGIGLLFTSLGLWAKSPVREAPPGHSHFKTGTISIIFYSLSLLHFSSEYNIISSSYCTPLVFLHSMIPVREIPLYIYLPFCLSLLLEYSHEARTLSVFTILSLSLHTVGNWWLSVEWKLSEHWCLDIREWFLQLEDPGHGLGNRYLEVLAKVWK